MENATKALLISAAVLIVIVLIAVGVLLLKNSAGTTKQTDEVGKEISLATDGAIRTYQKVYIKAEDFNDFLNDFTNKYKYAVDVVNAVKVQNGKIRNQIELEGYAYQDIATQWTVEPGYKATSSATKFSAQWIERENYITQEFIPSLYSAGRLKKVDEPTNMKNFMYELLDVYKEKKDEAATYETFKSKTTQTILFHYGLDSEGYINKIYMIGRIKTW